MRAAGLRDQRPRNARERASRVFAIYGQLPSYRAMLDREGAVGPADVAIAGDEDAVAAQIRTLAEAGVTDFVVSEHTGGADRTRTCALLRTLLAEAPDGEETAAEATRDPAARLMITGSSSARMAGPEPGPRRRSED